MKEINPNRWDYIELITELQIEHGENPYVNKQTD